MMLSRKALLALALCGGLPELPCRLGKGFHAPILTADPDVRRARVLERPDMTEEKLDAILARQATEDERLAVATHVIRTDEGVDAARARVSSVISAIREKHGLH